MTQSNPYKSGSFEHGLWETWNRAFFQQPVHAQILEVENQLREHVHALTALIEQVDPGRLRRQLTDCMLDIETRAEDLSDIAEHQYLAVVTRSAREESDSDDRT